MAESTEAPVTAARSARPGAQTGAKFAEWVTTGVVGWVLTSILAGSGAAYVMSQAEISKIEDTVEPLILEAEARLKARLAHIDAKQAAIELSVTTGDQGTMRSVAELAGQLHTEAAKLIVSLGKAATDRHEILSTVENHHRRTLQHLEALREETAQISRQVVAAEGRSAEAHKSMHAEIRKLSDLFSEYQRAFVEELTRLAEDGRRLISGKGVIGDESAEEVGGWIARANYMIRSLAIPTEAGWLRDMSAVKEDLREAMEEFDRSDEKARLDYARSVLVIVEAVRDLARGGRIP